MSLGRKIVTGAAWGQAGQLVAFTMQMLLQIVLARGLGTGDYGLFAALNGAVYLMVAIASGGAAGTLNSHLLRLTHRYGRAEAAYLFWRIWAWRLIVFGAIVLGVVLLAEPVAGLFLGDPGRGELMVAAVIYMTAIGMFQIANLLFYGLLLTRDAAIGVAVSATANVVVCGVLVSSGAGLLALIWGLAATQGTVCLLQLARGWAHIRPAVGLAAVEGEAREDVRGLWRFSLTVWGIALLTQALGKQTDLFTMQLFRVDPAEIGFYNLAVTLALAANTIFLIGIGSVALAGLSSINARSPERLSAAWRALCGVAPTIALPLLVFVAVFAEPIVAALYGDAYRDAALLLQIFAAFAIGGQLLGGGSHTTCFTAMGTPRRALRARAVTGVVNVTLNCILIPLYGALGAVIGTGLCGVLTVLYEYVLIRRDLDARLPWSVYGRAAICVVPGLVPAWFLAPHFGLAGVVVAAVAYLGCYVALALMVRPVSVDPAVVGAMPHRVRRLVRIDAGAGGSSPPPPMPAAPPAPRGGRS